MQTTPVALVTCQVSRTAAAAAARSPHSALPLLWRRMLRRRCTPLLCCLLWHGRLVSSFCAPWCNAWTCDDPNPELRANCAASNLEILVD